MFIALVIVMGLCGARAVAVPVEEDTGPFNLILALMIGVLVTGWAIIDGRVRGKPLVMSASSWLFFTYPVGFPLYCVWSRGARGVLFCLGFLAILLLAIVAAAFITDSALGIQY